MIMSVSAPRSYGLSVLAELHRYVDDGIRTAGYRIDAVFIEPYAADVRDRLLERADCGVHRPVPTAAPVTSSPLTSIVTEAVGIALLRRRW
jgi:hypothetical protein